MDAEGTEPEIAADVIDLVKTFQQILERARSRPMLQVDEETVTVGQMIDYLRRRLAFEDRPLRLKQMLRNVNSRAGAGLHVSGAAGAGPAAGNPVAAGPHFWRDPAAQAYGFEAVMAEQAAVRDDWR